MKRTMFIFGMRSETIHIFPSDIEFKSRENELEVAAALAGRQREPFGFDSFLVASHAFDSCGDGPVNECVADVLGRGVA